MIIVSESSKTQARELTPEESEFLNGPSYVQEQGQDFVKFCDALKIDAQPDEDVSVRL